MSSIFTIERRKDFPKSFSTFFNDLQTKVITSTGDKYDMYSYLDRCSRFWPYRCGATGIYEYLKAIDVDIKNPNGNTDLLLTLELLINLLHWAPRQDAKDDMNTDFSVSWKKNEVENESERLLQNAEYILEQCCNMSIRKEENDVFPRYYITKRNVNVDAAVICVPELSDYLLAYYDVRNQSDLEFKKSVLTKIYLYLEPHRAEYKGLSCGTMVEEFFHCVNTFGIRHNTKAQIRMATKKKIGVCDKLFMMAIYILQTNSVNEYKKEMKQIRNKVSK